MGEKEKSLELDYVDLNLDHNEVKVQWKPQI